MNGKDKLPSKKHAFLGLILLLFPIPVTVRLCKTSQLFPDTAFFMAFSKAVCPPSLGSAEKPRRKLKCPTCPLIPLQGRPPELPVAACPRPSRWHSWMEFLPDDGQHLLPVALAAPSLLGRGLWGKAGLRLGRRGELCSAHLILKTGAQTAWGTRLGTLASTLTQQPVFWGLGLLC